VRRPGQERYYPDGRSSRLVVRAVFFGTPEWAVPSLDALLAGHVDVPAVVTNPDRPAGRGMKLQPSPVKAAARDAGLEVLQPPSAKDPELASRLSEIAPDVAVVVAYGRILPVALLQVPPHGFVNVHFSLLPAYRGAAPVQRAVMDGREETGVSIMVLTEGMDEGPVVAAEATRIGAGETAGQVGERLAVIGARILVPALTGYVAGDLEPVPQDDALATYAPKVTPEGARLDWNETASSIANKVRGLNPAPGAWTTLGEERVKLWRGRPATPAGLGPGELLVGDALYAGTGSGSVVVEEAQVAGKKRMSGIEMARGLRLEPGARFE
jgi:methionyl-tRNA formyltransferase